MTAADHETDTGRPLDSGRAPTTVRVFDGLIGWLMRPRIRRLRRWSFIATLPIAILVGELWGAESGALVLAARVVLWGAVAVLAWRLDGERGEALRDLLMHPRGRAYARAELDILLALPRLALGRLRGRFAPGATYHRGSFGGALVLAFTPALIAEAAAFHLLLRGSLAALIMTALHVYALIWLCGYALGPRAYPHHIGTGAAVLRNGPMYRVEVPLNAIAEPTVRTERVADGSLLVERDGAVLLAARHRVDLWLELSRPVEVQRPFHEPLVTRRIAVASDEPRQLAQRLLGRSAYASNA